MGRKCYTTCSFYTLNVYLYACICQKANSMGKFLMVSYIYIKLETCLVHAHFLMGKIRTGSKFNSSTTDESSKNWDKIHNLPPLPLSLLKKIILIPNYYILKNQTITLLFVLHNSCLFPVYLILWQNFCLWTSVD